MPDEVFTPFSCSVKSCIKRAFLQFTVILYSPVFDGDWKQQRASPFPTLAGLPIETRSTSAEKTRGRNSAGFLCGASGPRGIAKPLVTIPCYQASIPLPGFFLRRGKHVTIIGENWAIGDGVSQWDSLMNTLENHETMMIRISDANVASHSGVITVNRLAEPLALLEGIGCLRNQPLDLSG